MGATVSRFLALPGTHVVFAVVEDALENEQGSPPTITMYTDEEYDSLDMKLAAQPRQALVYPQKTFAACNLALIEANPSLR